MPELMLQILVGGMIGLGAGYLGSFMVLRRMSLVGDALSHVALPGIALALIFHVNPFIGAFTALFTAIIIVWALEKKTELPVETLVGILFTLSLAIGILITPQTELLEALFGDIAKINFADLFLTGSAMLIIFSVMPLLKKGIIVGIISKDLTRSMGIKTHFVDFLFLLMVAIVVSLGLKVAGTLLMGSLVIIPAAAAKNFSSSLTRYTYFSAIIGALSAIAGITFAISLHLPPGPIVVIASGIFFLVTLAFKR